MPIFRRPLWVFNGLLILLLAQFLTIMVLLNQIFYKTPSQYDLELMEQIRVKNVNETAKISKFLVILVLTPPDSPESRRLVRNTWFDLLDQSQKSNVELLFPIGTVHLDINIVEKLEDEHKFHSDLLLLDHVYDAYSNLTEKVLQSIVTVHDKFDTDYIVKVDEDSFVNLPKLLHELDILTRGEPKKSGRLYWGFLSGKSHVYSSSRSKWQEEQWVLCDRYLPYALGGGYVLGKELISFIARNSKLLVRYFNEDVSVGAWLAGLDVFYVHDPRFDTEYRSRGCDNRYLITHKQSDVAMNQKYESLNKTGKLCWKEFRTRASYIYNWTVLPSQCCNRTKDRDIP